MTRKLFGKVKGRGTLGVSLLGYGLMRKVREADPHNMVEVLERKAKRKRSVVLRKDPLDK